MTSRLDRLFILLESGSSPATRRAAAKQLGQVQKSHSRELQNLLRRLLSLLSHSCWETRIAAGQATEAVLAQVPAWSPCLTGVEVKREDGGCLTFETFSLERVMRTGECLMSSEGREFDKEDGETGSQEQLAAQRQQLNKRLGLDVAQNLCLQQDSFVCDDDLKQEASVKEVGQEKKQSASEILAAELAAVSGKGELSSREKNRMKRKAKLEAKAKGKIPEEASDTERARKKPKLVESAGMLVSESSWPEIEDPETSPVWALETFCSHLMSGLLSPCWQARHGAATALRELVRTHGREGGRGEGGPGHRAWLENLALHLVTVLALDRFGDFVGDAVVAPVRETTAQVVGTLLPLLDPSQVEKFTGVLLQLLATDQWEARHGGLLAVKYLLAVRTDLSQTLLPRLYHPVSRGLADMVDDVVGVAAAALLPVTTVLVSIMPGEVASLCDQLWADLLDLDDLTSSTHSIMALLAAILSQGDGPQLFLSPASPPLSELVPRLYPFLSHSSSGVRGATLSTLRTLCSHPGLASSWLPSCVQDLLRHLYQRALVEHQAPNLGLLVSVWNSTCSNTPLQPLLMATCPWFGPWICLISGSASQPLDSNLLLPPLESKAQYIGGQEARGSADQRERERAVARARHTAAQLLGRLAAYIVRPVPGLVVNPQEEPPLQLLLDRVLIPILATRSAHQQLAVALLVLQWVEQTPSPPGLSTSGLPNALLTCLSQPPDYDELKMLQAKLVSQARDLQSSLHGYQSVRAVLGSQEMTVEQLASPSMVQLLSKAKLAPHSLESLLENQASLATELETFHAQQNALQLLTLGSLAGALAYLGPEALPMKLNPVIKPVMEAVKRQDNDQFQALAARSLTRVLSSCLARVPSPCDKVVRNLCSFSCSNPSVTPLVDLSHLHGAVHPESGILTLHNKEKRAERINKSKKSKKGGQSVPKKVGLENATPLQSTTEVESEEEMQKVEVQVRGAVLALREMANYFGPSLPEKMPQLWGLSFELVGQSTGSEDPQALVNGLEVVKVLAPSLHQLLVPSLQTLQPCLLSLSTHQLTAVRHMAATTISSLASLPQLTVSVVVGLVETLLPHVDPGHSLASRQGAVETIHALAEELGIKLVPYIVLLVVSVLGAMSDPDQQVRLLATNTFASLVRLMPLDCGSEEPEGLPPALLAKKKQEAGFLDQLLNNRQADNYQLTVPVSAELRSYQVVGVNWLAFLCKYKLHGILCDDMGLGKTLQTISMLASHHQTSPTPHQSLVICPTTLGGHWLEEVGRFVAPQHLNPFLYSGPPTVRAGLRHQVPYHNLIITSYDIVRNDIEFFGSIKWNYLVLDEGHVIKNTKTKTAIAIRQLVASHRLVLTGTPIQNGVVELWALFDFLMPGYLGSEKQFTAKYSRPILASRDSKSSSVEQEAGALALESLHRQTLPFILRRLKEDVLQDLPPKITQDYYCYLSPLQTQLYQDFARSQAQAGEEGASAPPQHVFQALQYLRKVCNHPKLVLSPSHPSYSTLLASHLDNSPAGLLDIRHAAKLTALKQLLTDLGLGEARETTDVVSPHRALVFCQLKAMLDTVETDLLAKHLPSISYLRLDGSVPAANRHSIVSRFNADPSIDLLLLSTSVGGLGLNLTGADTVIFVEHDWNPSKDLQAMDRAHRIGQKKVVNVYRLITRDTIEEKIMSLQKFKLHTANTVITTDNSSLASMQTGQVLDLFSLDTQETGRPNTGVGGSGTRAVLDNLPELWEETEYSEEYDLDTFISGLGSKTSNTA